MRCTTHLTPRERDVVRGVIAGRTNREIARELDLGEQAVKNVLSTVYQKCDVRNRLQLALFVVKHDLLPGTATRDEKESYGRGRR